MQKNQTKETKFEVFSSLNRRPEKATPKALPMHLLPYADKNGILPELTVPGQSMSVKKLIEVYQNGFAPTITKPGLYEKPGEPTNGINPRTLDLVEIQEIAMRADEARKAMEEARKEQSKRLEEQRQAKIREKIEQELINKPQFPAKGQDKNPVE